MISCAMCILDQDMAANPEISGIYYGFKCHGGGFGIEGFVLFNDDKDEAEVGRLLPGMVIRIFHHNNDANHFCAFVHCTAIFTKWGNMVVDDSAFTFEIHWHYHELNQVHVIEQEFDFTE